MVLIGLVITLFVGWWALVQTAPGVLSRLLPPGITLAIGTFLLILSAFSAFTAGFFLHDGGNLVGSLVTAVVGLWFMVATLAGARGSERYEIFMRHLMPMVALLVALLLATLYIDSPHVLAILQTLMILAGFILTTRYFRIDA